MATATGLVLTVAQTLFSAMQTREVRELCSAFGYESQLADLERTVETIKAVLLDADSKHQELSHQGKIWLGKLKDAVYDADDLFDRFTTIAQQQKRVSGCKISKKVCRFFSSDNQFLFSVHISRKIKNLRKEMDGIADDRDKFGFGDVYVPVQRRSDTSSFVHESSIIGRDTDKEKILDLLRINSAAVQDRVCFVSIVGIGGLGKTALAQYVFQDERITNAFEPRMWVCVSDEFSLKNILSKMLGKNTELQIEELQQEVRRKIEEKKYFLVLDDVWMESRDEWAKLTEFLLLGAMGSRTVVTTRSERVAKATGNDLLYKLKGLSDEDSLCLFERMAFGKSRSRVAKTLVEIGKCIVKKCANVPLAIRVIGSMLYGQDEYKWRSFQRIDLANMAQGEDGIMPILKLSYHNLTPQLKTCFSYCALFPKDYGIGKELLISLWLAEGFLECPNDMQNIEDVGEEYFTNLLHRCFFQDMKMDEYGEIHFFKMHDLIHDLAQQVAGKELCLVMETTTSHFNEKIRHVSFAVRPPLTPFLSDTLGKLRTMRTLFRPTVIGNDKVEPNLGIILAMCQRLRVLDLHDLIVYDLGNLLNHLSHLRYLDLSGNDTLEMLPNSMSKLFNLRVLKLCGCSRLKELPADIRELVNLRHLNISFCDALTHMPAGMGSLVSLCKLTKFVVGREGSNRVQKAQLRELMPLINLRDHIEICFREGYSLDSTNSQEGSYLLDKKHIKALVINNYPGDAALDERSLECLQPHDELRGIQVNGYNSIQLPDWAAKLASYLPHLVRIRLCRFDGLLHLPRLSQLCHLKRLELEDMPNVEYMEDDITAIPFFPSLEKLYLSRFTKLKGWWRSEAGVEREAFTPAFSRVYKLKIIDCRNMTSFPGCPHVKELHLRCFNEAALRREEPLLNSNAVSSSSDIASDNKSGDDIIYLNKLSTDNVGSLNSLFGKSLRGIRLLEIDRSEGDSLTDVVENFYPWHTIEYLYLSNCWNLKSMSGGGIEHMTNLQRLSLVRCRNLELEEEEDGMPWKAFYKLIRLGLFGLPKVVKLPEGIQCLTSLGYLVISECENLEALPEWIHHLTSLRSLHIEYCPKLMSLPEAICRLHSLSELQIEYCEGLRERCREPDGEDWRKIRHIPKLVVKFRGA